MRRFMLALLLTAALSPAQSDSVRVGCCNGRMAESTDMQLAGNGWTECALRLPSSVLSAYKGSGIVAVRAALLSRVNTDTLRVWVRKTLGGRIVGRNDKGLCIIRYSDGTVKKVFKK